MGIIDRSLARTMDVITDVRSNIMPVPLANHGIVINPATRRPHRRPGRVGDIRHVRIDVVHVKSRAHPVVKALDLLYADLDATTRTVVDGRIDDLRRMNFRKPLADEPSQWSTKLDMVVRPLAARGEGGAVSIWAEIDAQAHEVHARSGYHVFGDIVTTEPRIERDAVVVKGAELDDLSTESQIRITAANMHREARAAAARQAQKRKIGLTASFVALVMTIALGGVLMASVLAVLLVSCVLVITHYNLADRPWKAVERWLTATQDAPHVGIRPPNTLTAWQEIERVVSHHAPDRLEQAANARASIERLITVTHDILDPTLISRVTSLTNGVSSLVESYRRPARFAVGQEAHDLARDLTVSLAALAATADEIRRDALAAARDDFDTQRRYLEARTENAMLSPIG